MAGSIKVDRPNAADSTFGYRLVEPPTHLTTYLVNMPLINLNLYAQSKLDTLDYVACASESCGRYTKYLKYAGLVVEVVVKVPLFFALMCYA